MFAFMESRPPKAVAYLLMIISAVMVVFCIHNIILGTESRWAFRAALVLWVWNGWRNTQAALSYPFGWLAAITAGGLAGATAFGLKVLLLPSWSAWVGLAAAAVVGVLGGIWIGPHINKEPKGEP